MGIFSLVQARPTRVAAGLGMVAAMIISNGAQSRAASRAGDQVTLAFAAWDPVAATAPFINPCAAKLHVKVVSEQIPFPQIGTKLQTGFAAGTAPDFFYVPEPFALTFAAAGELLDQTSYRAKLGVPASLYLPQVRYTYHGKLIGIGLALESMMLFYNKAVFAKAGVAAPPSDAAHAWTWSQFVAVAKKLTIDRHGLHPDQAGFDSRHIVRYGVNIAGSDDRDFVLPFVYSNGGQAFDKTGTHFLLNQPAAASAIQAVADLAVKHHVAPTPVQMTANTGALTLASGRLAMEVSGNWTLYFDQYPTRTYPLGIGVLPMFKQYRTGTAGSPLGVWAHTAHPVETMQMVACIANSSIASWRNGEFMPTVQSAYTPNGLKQWAYTSDHPSNYVSVAVDTLKYGIQSPIFTVKNFSAAWDGDLQPVLDQIFNGKQDAQSALNTIQPRIDATLAN